MAEVLRLPEALAQEMVEHLLAARPNEGCGILASRDGTIEAVLPMANAAASPLRYSFDSREQFHMYRSLEEQGLELAGVYHSHTRTPAHPSPTDVRLATEDVPYIIVSLAQHPPDIRAFRIIKEDLWADEGKVREVHVTVVG